MKFIISVLLIIFIFETTLCQNLFLQTTTAGNIKGKIQQVEGKNYGVFLGIPYAKPPVGNLRFRDPQPLESVPASTVIDASNDFGNECIQAEPFGGRNQSEDCLFLNILTPKSQNTDGAKYPVMFWIHGGGFIIGSADHYPVEGTLRNIVSRGVVFVSINYRLGPFGFLTTRSSAAAGNYGLLDQVEALNWVNKNIQFFGGDTSKVTIFGESAGGMSASFLTMSPLTKGLFNQAILMSGSALSSVALMSDVDPNDNSANILEALGCREKTVKPAVNATCPFRNIVPGPVSDEVLKRHEKEIECLRSKPVTDITHLTQFVSLAPRIDGKFLPESPDVLVKKRPPYNFMIGVDKDELAPFQFSKFPGILSELVQSKDEFYRSHTIMADCKVYKYPDLVTWAANYHYGRITPIEQTGLDERHFWFQQSYLKDTTILFYVPAYLEALAALSTNNKVYLYSWDWQNAFEIYDQKTDFYWKGAAHASELKSLFDRNETETVQVSQRDKSQDKKAVETFGKLFTNFAKFGNPTPEDDVVDGVIWQPLNETSGNYLSIDMPKVRMMDKFYELDVRFWTKWYPGIELGVSCS